MLPKHASLRHRSYGSPEPSLLTRFSTSPILPIVPKGEA